VLIGFPKPLTGIPPPLAPLPRALLHQLASVRHTGKEHVPSDKKYSAIGGISSETKARLPNSSFTTTLDRDVEFLWLWST
jgi:hypothetical protein